MDIVLPVALIGAISAFLAYHHDYDDGLFGRSAFAVIIMMTVVITFGPIFGRYRYDLPLEFSVLLWALAVFMFRHAWRFMRFKITGKYSWRDNASAKNNQP